MKRKIRKEEKREVISQLIKKGFSVSQISELLDFPEHEVKELQLCGTK